MDYTFFVRVDNAIPVVCSVQDNAGFGKPLPLSRQQSSQPFSLANGKHSIIQSLNTPKVTLVLMCVTKITGFVNFPTMESGHKLTCRSLSTISSVILPIGTL